MKNIFKIIKNNKGYISLGTIIVAGLTIGLGSFCTVKFINHSKSVGTNSEKAIKHVDKEYEKILGDKFKYQEVEINGVKGIDIVAYTGSLTEIEIPDYIDGKKVISICGNIDSKNGWDMIQANKQVGFVRKGITEITIPNTVLKIGNYAFMYNDLKEVNIPNGVEEIGEYAFSCNKITKLNLGNTVKTIDSYAFMFNELKELTLPKSLENLSCQQTFDENYIRKVNISSDLYYKYDHAFNFIFSASSNESSNNYPKIEEITFNRY